MKNNTTKIELLKLSYHSIWSLFWKCSINEKSNIEIVTREFSIDETFKLIKEMEVAIKKLNKLVSIEEENGIEKVNEEFYNYYEYYNSNETENEIISIQGEFMGYNKDGSKDIEYFFCKPYTDINKVKQFLVNLYLNGTKKTIYELAKEMVKDSGIVIITVNK